MGFRYHPTAPLLWGELSMKLHSGERWALIGPSGCGKSTLLAILGGLWPPTCGQRQLDGGLKPRGISTVLQDYGLFPWKRVRHNIELPHRLRGQRVDAQATASELLRTLGITDLLERWPDELSGGQRQRVALARALITNPQLLLLDEPFSAVDAITRQRLQGLVEQLWQRYQFASVLVTHDVHEAARLADHVLVLAAASSSTAKSSAAESSTDESSKPAVQRLTRAPGTSLSHWRTAIQKILYEVC
ncbi:MAG: ATP-binding cassette domain-containing protein [Bacteroidota bacterium]